MRKTRIVTISLVTALAATILVIGNSVSTELIPKERTHVVSPQITTTPPSEFILEDKTRETNEEPVDETPQTGESSPEDHGTITPENPNNDPPSASSPPSTPQAPSAPPPTPEAPSCPSSPGGGGSAPGVTSAGGVGGTTTADIQSFSTQYNAIRVANCLQPIPAGNFRYDSCMEQRLFWIAEDPSEDPLSAWGHVGSVRSDGVPSVGCDGNLAGGMGNTGATVAQKWWDSASHRASLYRPTASIGGVCIYFAMTHGGVPNEPTGFTRAAARWGGC